MSKGGEYYKDLWLNDFDKWEDNFRKNLKRFGLSKKKIKLKIAESKRKHDWVVNQIEMKQMIELENT